MAKTPKKTAAKPKAEKKSKPEKKVKAAAAPKPAVTLTGIGVDPKKRALFLQDLKQYKTLAEAVAKATSKLRAHCKTIKGDGFLLEQVKIAVKCETPEGELEVKNDIANRMLAAKYVGVPLGNQLDLFLEPDRTPSVDRAADEGQRDCMEGKTAKPAYDPSTPQYASYLAAYHAETERRVTEGIKPLEGPTKLITKAEKDAGVKAAADAAEARSAANAPVESAGEQMKDGETRAEFLARKRANKAEADRVFGTAH